MRVTTLLKRLLNLQGLRVTGVRFEGDAMFIAIHRTFRKLTCPHCGCSKTGRESKGVRAWRHLGVWGKKVFLEGEIRRLRCDACDRTVTEAVPWARHGSDFTRAFEDAVGLMAQKLDKTAVATLFGIAWVTVGKIAERVVAELLDPERLRGLRRIGVDEISFRKRHRYLTVVTDHATGRVVWVAEGRSSAVLKGFFEGLGPEACAAIEIVTMDMSAAYRKAVQEAVPDAQIAYDHFHIAQLAHKALNEVRCGLARDAKNAGSEEAGTIKNMRWPTLHRGDSVPKKHLDLLAALRPDQPLGRAYLLKESLLDVLGGLVPCDDPLESVKRWTARACRSRLAPFVRLSRTIRGCLDGIRAFLEHRVTNALAEGTNNKIRLLSHRAYGFHSAAPLIATIYLCCGGIRLPDLQLL